MNLRLNTIIKLYLFTMLLFTIPNTIITYAGNDIKDIALGLSHTLILKYDGSVWASGSNSSGQLGIGSTSSKELSFIKTDITDVAQIFAGRHMSVFVKKDGSVWVAGLNNSGQLGDGTNINKSVPVKLDITNIIDVAFGEKFTVFLKSDGTVWVTGDNTYGQFGINNTESSYTLVKSDICNVIKVAAGDINTIFLKDDGTVWGSGSNNVGRLGLGSIQQTSIPLQIDVPYIIDISAGYAHTVFLQDNGDILLTGWNYYGEIGDETNKIRTTPRKSTLLNVNQIIAKGNSTLCVKTDGTIWGTGKNDYMQINTDSTKSIDRFTQLSIDNIEKVYFSSNYTIFSKDDGSIWALGMGTLGQLGLGSLSNLTQITDVTTVWPINIDTIFPEITLSLSTISLTKDDINIIIETSDNIQLYSLETPNDSIIYINNNVNYTEFTVSENGIYSFIITDCFNNKTMKSIEVINIDKESPDVNLSIDAIKPLEGGFKLLINAYDNTGIKHIILPNGNKILCSSAEYIAIENDVYYVTVEDLAGNITTKQIIIMPNIVEDNWLNRYVANQLGIEYNSLTSSNYKSISNLDKSSQNLTGVLPSDFNKLINLNYLNLSDNQFIGIIPDYLKLKFNAESFSNNLFENITNQKQLVIA